MYRWKEPTGLRHQGGDVALEGRDPVGHLVNCGVRREQGEATKGQTQFAGELGGVSNEELVIPQFTLVSTVQKWN